MVGGKVRCKQSFFSLNLNPVLDRRNWIFYDDEGSKKLVLSSFGKRKAFRCPDCGLLAVTEE